jgi:ureidoacrylate peracid hydrolase
MKVTVPAEPEPIDLDLDRTALIVVDMQNAFCSRGGTLDVIGAFDEIRTRRIIEADKQVIEGARRRNVRIIYLRMAYQPDLSNAGGPESPNYWKELALVKMRRDPQLNGRFLTIGGWDWQIIDELGPAPGDIIVDKNRYSGFANTALDSILRTNNIKYLVFIGIATNVCVESTLRDAYFHEYFPVIAGDACGNVGPDFTQQATLWNVAAVFGWVTNSKDLVTALEQA